MARYKKNTGIFFLRLFILLSILSISYPGYSQGKLINKQQYEELQHTLKSLPTDSALSLILNKLKSPLCNRFDSARLYVLLGNSYSLDGKLDESFEPYNKALSLFTAQDGYLWAVKIHLNLSGLYSDKQEFTKAGTELYLAKKIVLAHKDTIYQHKISEYFAHLFYSQGNTDSAFYYLKNLALDYEASKDTIDLSRIYNNLAVLYKAQDLFHEALKYNQKSLSLSLAQDDEISIAESYNNIGVCYEQLYDKTDSSLYLKEAMRYYEESAFIKMKYTNSFNTAIENLARLNRQIGNDRVANEYYKHLELSGQKSKSIKILDVYRNQMLHNLNEGDLMNSAYYFTLYDSVINDIQTIQEKDFQQMLLNQRKLFQAEQKEQEQKIQLQEEQHKRLLIEQKQFITQTILVIFTIIVLGFFYYLRQRNKYLTLKAEQEKKQLKDAVLRTQMNPHFIFNALTAIQNSVLKEDQLITASYVSRFARLIRRTFDFANMEKVPLSEDIKALKDYIDTQIMRFGDKFEYEIKIDDNISQEDTFVPPLILQPLVENCIHHGFKQINHKGVIQINIFTKIDKIRFEVKDNGVGFHPTSNDGKLHATDIIKNRLALFFPGDENSYAIENIAEGGTLVSYELTIESHV